MAALIALSSALATLLLATLVRRIALARALVDLPGPRRSHSAPTPRGGGLAIVFVVVTAGLCLEATSGWQSNGLVSVLIALALTAAVGLADDLRSLPPLPRLLVHVGAALLLVAGLLSGSGPPWWFWWGLPLGVAVVALINIWNFMDGIDGLAASQALVIALALAIVPGLAVEAPAWRGLALVVAAACAGFLVWNLPPARLFLGDVGSGSLGLVIAGLLGYAVLREGMSLPLAMLLPSAFLTDASLTLGGRMLRGERWWQPHRQHLYQWAVRAGRGHGVISLSFLAWTVVMIGLARTLTESPASTRWTWLFGVYGAAAIIWAILVGQLREQARRREA